MMEFFHISTTKVMNAKALINIKRTNDTMSLSRSCTNKRRLLLPNTLSLMLLTTINFIFIVQGYTTLPSTISFPSHAMDDNTIQIRRQYQQQIPSSHYLGLKNYDEDESNNENVATSTVSVGNSNNNDEAQRLMDKVKQMRMEIAALTGQTVEDVEREAALKKSLQLEHEKTRKTVSQEKSQQQRQYIVPVPETVAEQIQQATKAIERAYHDGKLQKQIIRFALIPIVTSDPFLNNNKNDREDLDQRTVMFVRNDQDWPGGVQQIYREAAQPYTYQLLQQLRIRDASTNEPTSPATIGTLKPIIQERTLWDFDGSAIITASSSRTENEPTSPDTTTPPTTTLVQALVQPNTDNRYFNDIQQMDERLKKSITTKNSVKKSDKEDDQATTLSQFENGVVNLIINPFWTNATSWGFNIFAPNAQQRAQDTIFSPSSSKQDGYIETYCVITKTVRGEDCIAIKAYPYDWQLYAYLEEMTDRYYGTINTVHLGSSVAEPTITDFSQRLNNRTEFQYSKNMRQMQRTLNK